MRSSPRSLCVLALFTFVACDPAKVQEREAAEARAQATADSIAAALQLQMDSINEATVEEGTDDTTALVLDSGVWNIEAPDEEFTEEDGNEGLAYEDWKHVPEDTIAVQRRHFSEVKLDEYLKDPDLDYDRALHHDNLWWHRFTRWLSEKLERLFGTKGGRVVFQNLHYIILGIAILFLAWYFRKNLFGGVFGVGAEQARLVTEIEEAIEALDLDKLLREAEGRADWRLSLRYQWLKVLRRLVDEGAITWQPRYTDADYLAQLKDPALRGTFSELSFLFKWVWYGDAPMNGERYQRMRPAFEAVHQRSTPHSNPTSAPAAPAGEP